MEWSPSRYRSIGIATEGRFFAQAVGGDMLSKIGSGEEKHGAPPGFYLLTFGIAAFPGAWIVLCALPAAWRDRLDERIRALEQLRDGLSSCIGCGCLSLTRCALYNPGDVAAAEGPGARRLSPALRRVPPTSNAG